MLDIGCGPASLYAELDGRFDFQYVGLEYDTRFHDVAESRYGGRANFRSVLGDVIETLEQAGPADMVVALETFEHLPERYVAPLLERIAALRPKLFLCTVPVEVGPAVWAKNIGSWLCGYSRHAEYTWAETWWAGVYALDRLPLHNCGHKGFDWRWLAQVIRYEMGRAGYRVTSRKSPSDWLPAALSASMLFKAELP